MGWTMKTMLGVALGFLLSTTAAPGQGTILFSTRVTGQVNAPVTYWGPGGGPALVGPDYVGQLYAGIPGGALLSVGTPVPFRGDAGIGYITAGGRVVVPGIPGGSPAQVELRVWKSSLGATYESAFAAGGGVNVCNSWPVTLVLGGGGTPPAPDATLSGLQGFSMSKCFPEPPVSALGGLGVLVLACLARRPTSR